MTTPQTIGEYLAALNASLEVGLRSRRRIFLEIVDHLSQATQEQVRGGASRQEAERRAIAAFGSPQEVAARFEAGFVGALDRRLALGARWLHRWMTQRPSRVAVVWLALGTVLAVVVGALGTFFGARHPLLAATAFLAAGTVWALMQIVLPSGRRRLRAAMRDWKLQSTGFFAYPTGVAYITMVHGAGPSFTWRLIAAITLVYGLWFLAGWAAERAVRCAARRCAGPTEDDRRQAWSADHPWCAAVSDVVPLPLGSVALIAVYPGPVALRVALAVLVAIIAALAIGVVRLEQARREKDAYQRGYDGAT